MAAAPASARGELTLAAPAERGDELLARLADLGLVPLDISVASSDAAACAPTIARRDVMHSAYETTEPAGQGG